MLRATVLHACCVVMLCVGSAHAQAPKPAPDPQAANEPHAADQAELAVMKQDLQRLRSLLSQMQTNLGYVSTTTQPLRHQFELENEMWLTLINQMERRIQKLEQQSKR